MDIFIHQRTLDVGLVELWNAKRLVHDNAVGDDGAKIGGSIPSGKATRRGRKHEGASQIAKTGKEAEEVACCPDEVGC